MRIVHNQVYVNKGLKTYQVQVHVNTSGQADLQVSQDGLPFQTVKTYTQSETELVDLLARCEYRFVITGDVAVAMSEAAYTN